MKSSNNNTHLKICVFPSTNNFFLVANVYQLREKRVASDPNTRRDGIVTYT